MDQENDNKYSEYELWVRRLYATNMFHPVKLGLANMERLHAALGNPMDPQNGPAVVVHIAGTNGKGSVALKIARTLEQQPQRVVGLPGNLTVGLFCSPHVSSFRERMQVNRGELISEAEVVELLPKIYKICEEQDIPATFFEITTALAFAFYAKRHCDVVVLETGLGGRLDATNVIRSPALSIITSIGLEHTRILGDTIELIAKEKGGIIKPGRPVLVGPNVPHDVLRACAAEHGASAYYTCDDVLGRTSSDGTSDDPEPTDDYDLENARIATAAVHLLRQSHPQLFAGAKTSTTHLEETLRQGTAQRPPCRFEVVQREDDGVMVILDVAHNPPAMDYLVRKLQRTFPDQQYRMVVGMSSDKDLRLCCTSILQAVNGDASRIHLVEAAHPRAATVQAILDASSVQLAGAHYDLEDPSITKQINSALEMVKSSSSQGGEILVVCGSVFLMAEAREALGFDEPRDSACIAELAGAGVRHGQENFGNSGNMTSASATDKSL